MLKIMVLGLVLVVSGTGAIEASFLDDFEDPCLVDYNGQDSSVGSFEISGGKLKITPENYKTFSVMTSEAVEFAIGETLSLEVPAVSDNNDVFMMCSTTAGQPDGTSTFGFRFRRDGGSPGYARMHLYPPGDILADTLDPDPDKPATLCVKRTSYADFDYSIEIEGEKTRLGSFILPELSGITNLHIGAQAFNISRGTLVFDNLKIARCGGWGYHPMDFNRDCYVNMLDFAVFAGGWLDCTMPGEPGCVEKVPVPFSIVILPDTQLYSQDNRDDTNRPCGRKEVFTQMTTWIAENAEGLNIKFVLHMGDIVNVDNDANQWTDANEAMSILDGVVPYSLVVGNHDMMAGTNGYPHPGRDTTNFNNTFPYTRYENEPWYGGRMEDTNDDGFVPGDDYDNAYHYFQAAGMDFLVLTLEVGPTDAMLAWADSVISDHPDHRVILTTHNYMYHKNDTRDDTFYYLPSTCCSFDPNKCQVNYDCSSNSSNTGENIWQKLVQHHDNIDFVFSGHLDPLECSNCKGWLAGHGVHGNIVHQFLCAEWYDGWLRILTFVPQEDKIYVKTFSPWQPESQDDRCFVSPYILPGYNTDKYHQYDLDYDMD
ncbi:MAG: metallophosphoesterase [Planctomycetota bacterium]|jgi:hypothetical protein